MPPVRTGPFTPRRFLHSIRLAAAWTLMMPTLQASGNDGDETLRHYLSRSVMVVAGEIRDEPTRAAVSEAVSTYGFSFQVSHLIAGPAPGPRIPVKVVRPEPTTEAGSPPLKKGGKYILFLKPTGDWVNPTWEAADPWFGVQPHSYGMHGALTRLAKNERRRLPKIYDSTDDLLASLKNYDEQTRTGAIDLLGQRRERRAIGPLIELLADGRALEGSDNWIGGHAANALEAITGGPSTANQQEWRDWWKKNGGEGDPKPETKPK